MPVSLLQHRKLAGIHQNKLQDNLRRYSTTQAQSKGPDRSAIPDGKIHFGSSIHTVVNSNDELNRVSHQTTNPRQGIAAPLLMLLSQVRLADGINLISTLRDSIPQTPSRGGVILQNDPLRFSGENALPVRDKDTNRFPRYAVFEKKTTTHPPVSDDVKIEKRDFSCIEDRQHLTYSDVFRKVGETFSNPVGELAKEAQVINYYNNYKRCPTPKEIKNIQSITSVVDKLISMVTALLPGSMPLVVTQRLGGTLFRMIADGIDNKKLNVDDLSEANDQLLALGKSIVDFSPRNSKGQTIEGQLRVPEGLSIENNKILVNIKGEAKELISENGRYFTHIHGKRRRISYSPQTKSWEQKITNNNRIIKSLSDNVYFGHHITNKLNGAIDKNTLSRISPVQHGIYSVTSKQSGESFHTIKVGDKFYRYIPSNEKDVSISGVIKGGNENIKVSRFDNRYFIVNEERKSLVNYSPCRLARSPGTSCLHLSEGLVNKLNTNKKNGISASKIKGLQPSKTHPGLYNSDKGKLYLKYNEVYFKLSGKIDKSAESRFELIGKNRFGSKQITSISFSRENGKNYINTPEENMMESTGVSREVAMSHIEMHTDFTPVDIKRTWAESMHGPFDVDKRFSAKRWVTNKEPIMVYRQDNRSLDEVIAAGGFYPKKEKIGTIEDHMTGSRDQYSYVSTSIKRLKSRSYGKYEYAIYLQPHQGVDTAATLEVSHCVPSKSIEFAVPGIITPEQIKGWRKCN